MALRLLAKHDRTESEIEARLEAKSCSPETRAAVLDFLRANRLLDDSRVAEELLRQRTGKRSVGREKLRATLLAKGVPEGIVDEAIGSRDDEEELEAMAQALAGRKWTENGRARAARFLLSRGFPEELLESALERHFGASSS